MTASMTRVGALARKEFLHLQRDTRVLAVVLLMPVLQLVLFAYAISFDVDKVPTAIVDYDRTPASRDYLATYRGSPFFAIKGYAEDLGAVDRLFDTSGARIVVVVPPGFGSALDRSDSAQVSVYIDGSDTNTARIATTYLTALGTSYSREVTAQFLTRTGQTSTVGTLEPRIRTWYNPDRVSTIYLIPGLMVVVIMIVTVQQTAVTLVKERDQGTHEQMMVSPLGRIELMVGKLLPWTVLAFLDAFLIAVIGVLAFDVPVRGSIPVLIGATALFVVAALSLGLIVSAIAPTMESANVIALMIAFLPAFLLSGFAFPLASVPTWLQVVSYAFPGRYMVAVSRGVFLKGADLTEMWSQMAGLATYAVILVTLAALLNARREQ